MVLFRFLFAPVLLAVAVLSSPADRHAAPAPPAASHRAPDVVSAPERDAPAQGDARAPALHAAPTRPAAGP